MIASPFRNVDSASVILIRKDGRACGRDRAVSACVVYACLASESMSGDVWISRFGRATSATRWGIQRVCAKAVT